MKTEVNAINVCYHCNSIDISEISYDYVCRNCGTVQGIIKFDSKTSADTIQFQNFAINTTTIGNERERYIARDSRKIRYLSKLNSFRSHKDEKKGEANILAKTILEKLGRSTKDAPIILRKYGDIRTYIRSKHKLGGFKILIPCIIYFYYREVNIVIDLDTLLEVSEISKKKLNEFRNWMELFWPAYKTRNRKKYVLTKIGGIIGYGKLYKQSKNILDKFWKLIKDSKDEIMAGLVIGISITLSKRKNLTLSSICKSLNISQSSLQNSIQRKLFDRMGIENTVKGFKKRVELLEEGGHFKDL